MIEQNLRVSRTVGEGHSRAPDVIRLRKALKKTGHSRPASQPSGIYDSSIHDAVKRFQRDFGLEEDGIVRPGGPTQVAINVAHAALEAGGQHGYEQIRAPFAALHRAGLRFLPADDDPDAPGQWVGPHGRHVEQEDIRGLIGKTGSQGIQLAIAPTRDPITGEPIVPGSKRRRYLEWGGSGGGGRGNLPAGDLFKALLQYLFGESVKGPVESRKPGENDKSPAKGTPSRRTVPPNNPPKPIPPSPAEPPPEPEKGNKILEPAEQPPVVLPGAEPVEGRPGVFIFPDESEVFNKPHIVEHKGGEKTRDFNEEVRDWFLTPEREAEGWEHVEGGRKSPGIGHNSGKSKKDREMKEEFIPNPVKDFQGEQIKEKVDGRAGSNFVDLTFHNKKTRETIRIQTVDLDKNGKPTQRELDNAWSIWKRTGETVILIKKPWQ